VRTRLIVALIAASTASQLAAQETSKRDGAAARQVPTFATRRLIDHFLCEGASFGDFNRDGKGDVVSGPFWWEGPDFVARHEIAEPVAYDPLHYSKNFFAFPYDFDRDGWLDVFFVGFPGERAWWAENPRGEERRWAEHDVFPTVDNESPWFTDVTGDGQPELVCISGGAWGYATFDPKEPAKAWTFHAISPNLGLQRFTHGLGVGDVNGDGRPDLLERTGWWEQPAELRGDPQWKKHDFLFSSGHGGAQMLVDDVDGDGDADVISSLNAHEWGLSWFEQVQDASAASGASGSAAITFLEHRLMNSPADPHPKDVCFSELHALAQADVDGDGLKDFVTGKRYWAHGPTGSPGAGDPPVLYWWKLVRKTAGGAAGQSGAATFEPHLIHDDSGVGVQVVAGDLDGDGRCDVVVGNKKGTFVHLQVDGAIQQMGDFVEERLREQQRGAAPAPAAPARHPGRGGGELPKGLDGKPLNTDFESGDLRDWTLEGAAFEGQPIRGDAPKARNRESSLHEGDFWIGGYEKLGDDPQGALLSAPFRVTQPWASFLVGGGGHLTTVVELLRCDDSGALRDTPPFFRCFAANYESLQPIVVDLSREQGTVIRIRLTDHQGGHWGHLNFDDFRLHQAKPELKRPDGVPLILEPDPPVANGLLPADAAKAMTVAAGFTVDLIAAEPDLHQPIALCVDPRGRLWVVEAHSYPQREPEGQGKDNVVVFEDKDLDGSFETRTLFMKGLNLVSGIEVGFGGVWIGAAPWLLFVPDRDDDLVPDGEPEILLDGWHWEDTHETLNAFAWGPDGWLYGCHGVFTHSRVGKPGTPDDQRIPLNAAVWRFHPTRRDFEIFAEGTSNPWGLDWNDHGEAFVSACVIPHLFHLVPGGRYIRQAGSHFNPYTYVEIDTIADHPHYPGNDPWGANGRSHSFGGGHAHCGALIYLADQFPAEYRNSIFMGNIHGNRVNRDLLEADGSSYVGRHGPDFLLANDKWFRHIASRLGPDGSVFLIDWYDRQACHHHDENIWNRSNGRMYRVSYSPPGAAPAERIPVNLPASSELALIRMQTSPNEFWVRRARVLLQERGLSANGVLNAEALWTAHADATRRLRGLWLLHACGKLDEAIALRRMAVDEEPHVRGWIVRLLAEGRSLSAAALAAVTEAAKSETSAVVRREIASALGRLPLEQRWEPLAALLGRAEDKDDRTLPQLCWYALEPLAGADPGRAFELIAGIELRQLHGLIVRRAAADPKCHEALAALVARVAQPPIQRMVLDTMHRELKEQRGLATPAGWPAAYAKVKAQPETARAAMQVAIDFGDRSALPELRAAAMDRGADVEWRRQAISALVQLKDAEGAGQLVKLVVDKGVRIDALRAAASFDHFETPITVLTAWKELDALERREAVETLTARAAWAKFLVLAIGEGKVARSELHATALRRMREFRNAELDTLIAAHVGLVRDTPEEKVKRIAELKAALKPEVLAKADLVHGRALFAATCMKCHVLFGVGQKIAPELTGSNRADLDYLLTNMVDPNQVIGKDYQVTNAFLKDGRIVSGILLRENEGAVTLQAENEALTVARADLASLKPSKLSLMPEGQLDGFAPDQVRDLVAYLQAPAQVEMRATEATVPYFFDGKGLEFWRGDRALFSVEVGAAGPEIVGRTTSGIDHNAFLLSDLVVEDFRLTLEVRLVGDQGNSGIQVRSVPVGDDPLRFEMKGWQCDIGPGWWGKLYEELGREVLSDVSGEAHIVKDGWNRYEITCTGSRVRTTLNGHVTTDLDDPQGARRGQIALQIHSGGPTEVRFRNLRLDLNPK
jgi:putative membrane-bound dehydrogenase-like protein